MLCPGSNAVIKLCKTSLVSTHTVHEVLTENFELPNFNLSSNQISWKREMPDGDLKKDNYKFNDIGKLNDRHSETFVFGPTKTFRIRQAKMTQFHGRLS